MQKQLGLLFLGLLSAACGGADSAEGATSSELRVVLSANHQAFPHQDGLAGQTAQKVTAGVRSLRLIDDAGNAWTLFDQSPASVGVTYDAGSSTSLCTIAPADVKAGHYVEARMVQDWSRFDVDATLHEAAAPSAGTLSVFQITTDGASVEGKSYPAGHYEHHFQAPNVDRSYSGELPVPDQSKTAGAEAVVEQGEWAVYFPLDLTLSAGARGELRIDVNMDHAFRWTDEPLAGYAVNVYDIAPPLYEPVVQFGGNRFDVTLASK